MVEYESIDNILSNQAVTKRAKEKWDGKSPTERIRSSLKYKHIFIKHNLPSNDWLNSFSSLSRHQRNILIKGELIRTYDSLPNNVKTVIKHKFGLSRFSSKWFKLSPKDKKILLKSVLCNVQE